MGKYSQTNRGLKVTTPLAPDTLLIEGFRGREAVSELFEFTLDLLAESRTPIPFDKLLGETVLVELDQVGGRRYFHGIVQSFAESEPDEEFTAFQAVVVPRLWLLTRNVQSRIFQNQTVVDILKTVFDGLDVTYTLAGTYAVHNYCVQYRESDFAFASRIMEEEGIYYYFTHTTEGHRLVVADHSTSADHLTPSDTINFQRQKSEVPQKGRIDRWRKRQQLCSRKFTVWDHSFELPGKNLEASTKGADSVKVGTITHAIPTGNPKGMEVFDYPAGFAHRFDGIAANGSDRPAELHQNFVENQRVARHRAEAETAASLTIDGAGTCPALTPGFRFTLKDEGPADGPYWLTSVEHEARVNFYRSGKEERQEYRNRFTCIPAEMPFRPARITPPPTIGLQTAVVVGPANEESFTDKHGRVKVQFNWDRQGKFNTDSSCWVRVAQGWAGKGWGMVSIPRIGQEVVIDFLEGDPDWPLIVGSVYNADQVPPFDLPAARTVQGLKALTHSANNDPSRYSGLGIETRSGQEHVYLHAQKDRTDSSNASHRVRVGKNYNVHVGGTHSRIIGFTPVKPEQKWIGVEKPTGSGAGGSSPPGAITASNLIGGFTMGQELSGILGSGNDMVFGTYLYSVINPLSLLSFTAATDSWAGFTAGTNYVQAMLGGAADLTYGGRISIYRGPSWNRDDAPMSSGWYTAGIAACTTLFTAAQVLECISQAEWIPGSTAALTGASKILYNVICALEITNGWANAEEDADDEKATPKAEIDWYNMGVQLLMWGTTTIGLAIGMGVMASGSGAGSGLADGPALHYDQKGLDYLLTSPSVTITATGSELEFASCLLQASMLEQNAYVEVEIEEVIPKVTIDCGADGFITLRSGMEMIPNSLVLAPEGITIDSAELITLSTEENNVVVDPEAGVTIQAAANIIEVADEGIVLTVGASSITLSDDAIILEAGGATLEMSSSGIVLNGVSLSLSGDSEVSVSAPAVMVG
jgi:type VI secretion system secreted protein VgrG